LEVQRLQERRRPFERSCLSCAQLFVRPCGLELYAVSLQVGHWMRLNWTYRSVHLPPFFTACRLTRAAWSLELGVAKLSSIPSSMVERCYCCWMKVKQCLVVTIIFASGKKIARSRRGLVFPFSVGKSRDTYPTFIFRLDYSSSPTSGQTVWSTAAPDGKMGGGSCSAQGWA